MIRALVFDLDGTLVDSLPDLHHAANLLLLEWGRDILDQSTIRGFIGHGIPALVESCLAFRGGPLEDLTGAVRRFKQIYEDLDHRGTVLFPGVFEALDHLADRGYRLALCTNKDWAPARRILTRLGILQFFATLVGGDTLGITKPDPRPLIAAIEGCDASLTESLYVGDSEVDAELARRTEIGFLLFSEGYRKSSIDALTPIASFSDYAALPNLVEQLRRPAS